MRYVLANCAQMNSGGRGCPHYDEYTHMGSIILSAMGCKEGGRIGVVGGLGAPLVADIDTWCVLPDPNKRACKNLQVVWLTFFTIAAVGEGGLRRTKPTPGPGLPVR